MNSALDFLQSQNDFLVKKVDNLESKNDVFTEAIGAYDQKVFLNKDFWA